jgi:hypothetical protein
VVSHPQPPAPENTPLARPTAGGQGFAIAALVVGIAAFLIGLVPLFGAVCGAAAVFFGVIAARRGRSKGKWVTGLTLGSVATVTSVLMTVALINLTPTVREAQVAPAQAATPEVTAAPVEPVAEPAPSVQEAAAIREYWPLRHDLRVPQFIGMNLADAREEAERVGVHLKDEDDRDNRIVWVASNWTVVAQDTPAGSDERGGTYVRVRVLKNDEVDQALIAADDVDVHRDQRVFSGRVTGYPRDAGRSTSAVSVDGVGLSLDMVSPLAPGCGSPVDGGLGAATAELEKNLPIGQRVLVVMSEQGQDEAFLHVLSDTSNDPAVAPPGDSVNERLVRSGWWVPAGGAIDGGVGVSGYADTAVALRPYELRGSDDTQAAAYAPLIAAAGNDAVTQYIGTVGECHRAAEAELEAERIRWAENERERDRIIAEAEWRANQPVYCRDGDGDGICNER